MDITSNAVNSYQSNQRLSNSLSSLESAANVDQDTANQPLQDDAISISDKREIFDWLAQEFPHQLNSTANLNRLNQALHDYGVLSLADINQANKLAMETTEGGLVQKLEAHYNSTTSFAEGKQVHHLIQVYSTIEAAQHQAA